jgi:hypothetical protein
MNFQGSKKTNGLLQKNNRDSLERERSVGVSGTITSFGQDTAEKIVDGFTDVGKGVFEQLLGQYEKASEQDASLENQQNSQPEQPINRLEGGTVFSFRNVEEDRQLKEIKELIEQIRQEVKMIKKADSALMSEVSDIEKLTIDTMPEKPGIYHVRFLEVVLKVLELLRTKISESGTWMEALKSKKAKRGSAFSSNSKKKGTQYSMSQELSNARSVQ